MTSMTEASNRRMEHPGHNVTKPRAPESAEAARLLAREALSDWGLDDDTAAAAALLLSELVANAVRHTDGPAIRIVIDRPAPERVYLAVVDREPHRRPVRRTPTPDDIGGRGLLLVDELADRWGYDLMGTGRRPWGKRVWAELKVSK